MSLIKKSGIITLCGRPNVGKSTLLNALVGEKLSIVSHKAQTTRSRLSAILNRGESQFVFVDTPGLHRPRNRLGDYMVSEVRQGTSGVDALLLLAEPIANVGEPEQELIARAAASDCPAVLAINKVDTLPRKEALLEVIEVYSHAHPFDAVVPISAKRGEGLEALLDVLDARLPEGPALFPEDMRTDQPESRLMGELLREKLLLCLEQEIPHGVAVEISRFHRREDGLVECFADIYCEKQSHKGIIIGRDGAMLKKVSTLARRDMERFLGEKVYLKTWIKVREGWRNDRNMIRSFGYQDEP